MTWDVAGIFNIPVVGLNVIPASDEALSSVNVFTKSVPSADPTSHVAPPRPVNVVFTL